MLPLLFNFVSQVCLVVVVATAATTAQHHFYRPSAYSAGGGLIFSWAPQTVPLLRQFNVPSIPSNNNFYYHHHHSPIASVAKAIAPPQRVPEPQFTGDSVTINADSSPNVITQGTHLGADQNGFAEDAPASIVTHGPQPGAYTAVTSDEPSESTQFHSQDGTGQFIFGHSSPEQARLESRSADGTVRGSYSYINPEGRTIKVTYTAGENGFQPYEEPSSDVLPKPVTETPEVAAARALHARLYDQAKWLAESSPENPEEHKDEPVNNVQDIPVNNVPIPDVPVNDVHHEPSPPVSNIDTVSIPDTNGGTEQNHQPDSLYTHLGPMPAVESDEELSYYGAAKGKPVPDDYDVTSKTSQHDYYGAPKYVGRPLAYSGAYQFPGYANYFPQYFQNPFFSHFPVARLHELRKQDTSNVDNNNQAENSAELLVMQARNAQEPPSAQDLEYYGAAKLLALSAGNHLLNTVQNHRGGKSLDDTVEVVADEGESTEVPADEKSSTVESTTVAEDKTTEAPKTPASSTTETPTETPKKEESSTTSPDARFSSYNQGAPVFVAVGVAPHEETKELASLRTALDVAPHPAVIPPLSVSQKAAYFGAVPVAAVHDAQVAPGQVVKDHQKLPVYIETS
jgi:hypothetical protein